MPTFEFDVPKGIRPNPEDIPTRVSVGGKEYIVMDGCFEAPIGVEAALKAHGFVLRQRPRLEIRPRAAVKEPEANPPAVVEAVAADKAVEANVRALEADARALEADTRAAEADARDAQAVEDIPAAVSKPSLRKR